MLSYLVDVDESMVWYALSEPNAVAIFFDFAAAFPSVEHSFIQKMLRARGWPAFLCRFVDILYNNIFCHISINGIRHQHAVRRDGISVSPLLPRLNT